MSIPATSRLSSIRPSIVEQALTRLDMTVRPGDHMHKATPNGDRHYRDVGESALRCIHASLLLANREPPSSILDFGCGSGRVTRWLRAAYPEAAIDASDVMADALAFVGDQFGARTWSSAADLESVQAPRTYDLIWVGSVLTHTPEASSKLLLRKFKDWLTPGGIAVVTLHGRCARARISAGKTGVKQAHISDFIGALADTGYAFTPPGASFGTAANSLAWALSALLEVGCRVVTISEHAWDKHQDVVAFQRV